MANRPVWSFKGLWLLAALLLSFAACSKYQSYHKDARLKEQVESRKLWEIQLSYKSGQKLIIDRPAADEILLFEPHGRFDLTKIPLGSDGRPGQLSHCKLRRGDSCERLDSGQLLVVSDDDHPKFIALVDPTTLVSRFSADLPFQKGGEISFSGRHQIGNKLIFHHTMIKILKFFRQDSSYSYVIPYVDRLKYDIHLLDLVKPSLRSFKALDSGSLKGLNETLVKGKSLIIQGEAEKLSFPLAAFPPKTSEKPDVKDYLYFLDQFFLVDDGRVLIFSLANQKNNKFYYSINLQKEGDLPKLGSARDLAAMYPGELVLTGPKPEESAERMKSVDIEISGKKYKPEQFEFFPSGIVLVAKEKLPGDEKYAPNRVVIGIRSGDVQAGRLERAWEFRLNHKYAMGRMITDSIGEAVYFPDVAKDGSFKVIGLTVAGGRKIQDLPVNVQRVWNANGSMLRIVGTAVDFKRNLLFIHDLKKNRIICTSLDRTADSRLQGSQSNEETATMAVTR